MNAIANKQLKLPLLGEDAHLVQRCGADPVEVKVGGVKLDGGFLVREVLSSVMADSAARVRFMGDLGKADGILVRGRDGSAYLVEGQRLVAGEARPSVGQAVTFSGKDGKAIAGEYVIEAFFRGSGGLNSYDIWSRQHEGARAKAMIAPKPETNIFEGSKLGSFAAYSALTGLAVGVGGMLEAIAYGATALLSQGVDAALGTHIVAAMTGATAANIASWVVGAHIAVVGVAAACFMIPTMALEARDASRRVSSWFRNRALDAQDLRDNGAGLRLLPNRTTGTPSTIKA